MSMLEKGKVYAGRYRIEDEVGRGGMAVVYRAVDQRMNRVVALKVLYPYLAIKGEHKARFHREAQVVARLRHRNIVEIFDYSGIDSDESFIVTEFVDGATLKSFMLNHPALLPEVACMIVLQIAEALGHAHSNGVIHRDVKPENVMIGADGLLKLMDFGIAQIKDVQNMTVTGTMIGSPAHMSPEHIEGRQLDHRADVFSLGTLFYTLCTGRLPFAGNTAHALLKNILDARYVPAVQISPGIGEPLSKVIDKCLQRTPEDRYQSCTELKDALVAHLALFGLESSSAELQLFFKNPVLHQANLRNTVVNRLIETGRGKVRIGRIGEAVRHFDRALSLDESRETILLEIARLRRRVEIRRFAVRYLLPGSLFLLGGSAAIYVVLATGLFGSTQTGGDGQGSKDGIAISSAGFGSDDVANSRGQETRAGLQIVSPSKADDPAGLQKEGGLVRTVPLHTGPGELGDPTSDGFSGDVRPDAASGDSLATGTEIRALAGNEVVFAPDVLSDFGDLMDEGTSQDLLGDGSVAGPWDLVQDGIPSHLHDALDARQVPEGRASSDEALDASAYEQAGLADIRHHSRDTGRHHPSSDDKDGYDSGHGGTTSEGTEEKALIPVTVEGYPPAVEVFVDGLLKGTGKVEGLMLTSGSHDLRIHHPNCPACMDTVTTFNVLPDAKSTRIKEKIGFKPASLKAESALPGMVFVDDEYVGHTGERLTIRMESHRPVTIRVKVLFDRKELKPYETTAQVKAGDRTVVNVPNPAGDPVDP